MLLPHDLRDSDIQMLVNNLKRPTTSVKVAGIIAIIGSVLVLLGAALGFFAVLMLKEPQAGPELPKAARVLGESTMVFFFGLAILGLFTGVGVLRLEKWARISALVWSGITAAICALIVIFSVFVPLPAAPNAPSTPANFLTYARAATAVFYGCPLAIAIWWLILFNRKKVADQFVASGISGTLDPSGFPIEASAPSEPELPLPIAVLAGFLLLSSVSVFLVFFVPMPVILFAHAFHGPSGIAAWIATCLLSAVAGIGLLCRRVWSYGLTFGLQVLWLLSGTVTLISSSYPHLMREAISSMPFSNGSYPQYSTEQLRNLYYAGLAFPIFILALLLCYRSRFLEAAHAKTLR